MSFSFSITTSLNPKEEALGAACLEPYKLLHEAPGVLQNLFAPVHWGFCWAEHVYEEHLSVSDRGKVTAALLGFLGESFVLFQHPILGNPDSAAHPLPPAMWLEAQGS